MHTYIHKNVCRYTCRRGIPLHACMHAYIHTYMYLYMYTYAPTGQESHLIIILKIGGKLVSILFPSFSPCIMRSSRGGGRHSANSGCHHMCRFIFICVCACEGDAIPQIVAVITCVDLFSRVCVCACGSLRACKSVCASVCVCVHVNICVHIHTYICAFDVLAHRCECMYLSHTRIHTHAHAHAHTPTHVNIRIYTKRSSVCMDLLCSYMHMYTCMHAL